MEKSIYYRSVISRKNRYRDALLYKTLKFADLVRPLIEVFTRTNFGERYIRFSACLSIALIFGYLPILVASIKSFLAAYLRLDTGMKLRDNLEMTGSSIWDNLRSEYTTWYLFLAVFLVFSWRQRKYMRRSRSLFDFSKYSISDGDIHKFFYDTEFPLIGKANRRIIECYLEPLPFFVGGLLLMLLEQKLGGLLLFVSVMYSLGYMAAYRIGDNFVLDKIDEIICNQELEKAFMSDDNQTNTRGFRFIGNKPEDLESRRKLLPLLMDDNDVVEAK